MDKENKLQNAVSAIFDVSLKSAVKVDSVKAEYLSEENGFENQKLKLGFSGLNDYKLNIEINTDNDDISLFIPGTRIYIENYCGSQDMDLAFSEYKLAEYQIARIQAWLQKTKTYKYIKDASKWYRRTEAIKRIKEYRSLEDLEWFNRNEDDNTIPIWLTVWEAEYGDTVFRLQIYDSEEYDSYIYDNIDEEELRENLIEKNGNLPITRLMITVDDYYSATIDNLTNKELADIGFAGSTHEFISTDIIVKTLQKSCSELSHSVEKVPAIVKVKDKYNHKIVEIEFDAYYCRTCNRYYILQEDYDKLITKGTPQCKVIDINYIPGPFGYPEQSFLKMCGYSVDKKTGLSSKERKEILNSVIVNGIYTKERLISFLEWLIRQNASKPSMVDAVNKWENDILYLRDWERPTGKPISIKGMFIQK